MSILIDLLSYFLKSRAHVLLSQMLYVIVVFYFFLAALVVRYLWRQHLVEVFNRFAFFCNKVLVFSVQSILFLLSFNFLVFVRIHSYGPNIDYDLFDLFVLETCVSYYILIYSH